MSKWIYSTKIDIKDAFFGIQLMKNRLSFFSHIDRGDLSGDVFHKGGNGVRSYSVKG